MKVIIKDQWANKSPQVEDVEVLFQCKHVEDRKIYKNLEDVEFIDFNILIVRNDNSHYGFSCLWDNRDGTYHYDGLGHSGASSIITALLQKISECEVGNE